MQPYIVLSLKKKKAEGLGEAGWVRLGKALATEPGALNAIAGTRVVEGEEACVLPSDLSMSTVVPRLP